MDISREHDNATTPIARTRGIAFSEDIVVRLSPTFDLLIL
jgi:hypothetical protein